MRSRSGAGMVSRLLADLTPRKFLRQGMRTSVQMNNTRERSTGTSLLWGEETVKSRDIDEIEYKINILVIQETVVLFRIQHLQ